MQETKRTFVWRAAFAWLLAVALAFGLSPAPAFAYEGDMPATPLAEEQAQASVKVAIYGPVEKDGSTVLEAWCPTEEWTVESGKTAADVTVDALERSGLDATYDPNGSYGFYLESIVGPDGEDYGWDQETGSFWSLYVNGQASSVGASSVVLEDGDVVSWVFCNGAPVMPSVADDGASLPSFDVAWGNNGGAAAGAASSALPTMSASSVLAWKQTVADITTGASASVSDLLVVDGLVYSVASTAKWSQVEDGSWASESTDAILRAFDAADGSLVREVTLPSSIDSSACRLAYSDGVIAVPLSGGSVVGIAADTLAVRWHVLAEIEGAQSLNTVGVADGSFVASYSDLDSEWKACASRTVCIDAKTGDVRWTLADEGDGMYWGGFAFVEGYAVMGTDAGILKTVDLGTGKVVDELSAGASVRSTPVACGGSSVAFVTNDGVFHKAVVSGSGKLEETGKVSFAASSTCTPSIIAGKAVIGGATQDYKGVLACIDVDSMTVESIWNVAAEVKGRPVVAADFDGTAFAYFTCNAQPGSLYGIELSSGSEPFAVCTPEGADANWCMASPVSDNAGRLFYTNDAGVLFAVSYDRACGYADVMADEWYVVSGDFEKVVSSGLMLGVDPTTFQPHRTLTRAEVVTILHRAAGSPEANVGSLAFVDVPADAYYREALAWAVENGLAFGYGDSGAFGPNDEVTREQVAAFLGRFAEHCGKGSSVANADTAAFDAMPDRDKVSDWAKEAPYLAWCCDEGVISGSVVDGVAYLDPQGNAERCMMAKMIVRTLEALA